MNVLLWLTHHIMLFLFGLQSSMIMSSCSQSRADLLTMPLWNRRLSSGEARTAMTEQFRVGFIVRQRIKELAEKLVEEFARGEWSWRGWEKGGEEERRKAGPAERCLLGRQPLLSSSHPISPSLSPASRSRAVCRLSRSQVSTNWELRLTALREHTHTHAARASCIMSCYGGVHIYTSWQFTLTDTQTHQPLFVGGSVYVKLLKYPSLCSYLDSWHKYLVFT